MLNFYDFIQVFVFTRNHHLNCTNGIADVILFVHLVDKRMVHFGFLYEFKSHN